MSSERERYPGAGGAGAPGESGAAVRRPVRRSGRPGRRPAAPRLARTYGAQITRFGSSLHVDKEGRRTAPLSHQAVALLLDLARLLAVLAAHRERQRAQALLADFLAALEAVAVGALFQAAQRLVDLVERLGLHLDERELDLVLDVQLGRFRGVEHALDGTAGAFRAHAAHPPLHLAVDLAAAFLEDALQFVVPIGVHVFPSMSAHMSPAPFPLRDLQPKPEALMQ